MTHISFFAEQINKAVQDVKDLTELFADALAKANDQPKSNVRRGTLSVLYIMSAGAAQDPQDCR